jgi:predicted SAM-dependent methyltransferase
MQKRNNPIRLNLGCGLMTPQGWINIDGSWNARLAKHPFLRRTLTTLGFLTKEQLGIPWDSGVFIHDIRKPLPFDDECATAVYASHVLEHLYFEEGQQLIREAFRVLEGGGILRVVVPDLHALAEEYLGKREHKNGTDNEEQPAADRFNQQILMRWPSPTSYGFFYRIYAAQMDFHSHKWMYDLDSLSRLFQKVGFEQVQGRNPQESAIDGIHAVEDPSRIVNGAGVCVEGVKPGKA